MTAIAPKPDGMAWVCPYLVVSDVETAMAFYEAAFAFEPGMRYGQPDGAPFYGEMHYRGNTIMVGLPKAGTHHPKRRSSSTSLYCYTEDVDALAARARGFGVTVVQEPTDQFWGDRTCLMIDPEGHPWMWATHVKDVDLPRTTKTAKA